MTNGWNQARGLADKHTSSSSGLFVRLANDRDKIVGLFVGEPYARETHWMGDRYEVCTGNGCDICGDGKRPSVRFTLNFYIPGEREMKIIEGGVSWFKDLVKLEEKYSFDKSLFEIERRGAAGDPKTTYSILPDKDLSAEQRKEIKSLRLHDLPKVVSGGGNGGGYGGGNGAAAADSDRNDDEPIDRQTANALIGRLKALPREAVDRFLERCGVQRVAELKRSDEKAADAYITSLETKYREQTKSNDEVDPFA